MIDKNDYNVVKPQSDGLDDEEKKAFKELLKRHKKTLELLAKGD